MFDAARHTSRAENEACRHFKLILSCKRAAPTSAPADSNMVDTASALAALAAAGDNAESLKAAILAASFLDEVPGEDRQKLRGERAERGERER